MKKIYKNLISMIIAIFGIFAICACSNNKKSNKSIVCTIYPIYDWVTNILGENSDIEVTLLLDNGVDLHSYQASVDGLVKVAKADLFIYVGGESDEWCEDAIENSTNKDQHTISLLETLGDKAKEEEIVEGMEDEEEEGEEEEVEYDEHVWLSLKNASILCKEIEKEIAAIDSSNKAKYEDNLNKYLTKLETLDKNYESAVANASRKTILFGDRFPFRYLVDDYGLSYYAAFVGCSAETEASFETIRFLAGKVDELDLNAIFVIESSNKEIANTIKSATTKKDQQILVLNSIQSITSKDIDAGASYINIMEKNLAELKKAIA